MVTVLRTRVTPCKPRLPKALAASETWSATSIDHFAPAEWPAYDIGSSHIDRIEPRMTMAITSYHGTFYTESPEIIEQILRSWLSKNDLQMKPHRGFQMHYETDGFELYCYDAGGPEAPFYFLLEGRIEDAPDTATTRLRDLADLSRNAGLEFSIDYEQVDSEGNPLSAEKTIS
ncbi:GyrI-like domain-containing protein [Nocardia gamkensis]|uniref:GyrI-like domain-containing protein n=1 Tax=Nocardia gamkensis TaxID=352869 RepID=UPI0033C10FC6